MKVPSFTHEVPSSIFHERLKHIDLVIFASAKEDGLLPAWSHSCRICFTVLSSK